MSGPSVVVDRAPEGWTHIGGPGMHLLIGLDEDDERTIAASDAADGGDIDDVVEVLTVGGMRKAHHFVGVHWQPRTRIVAFGPVSALVTLADGTEHDVRATSSKVWTDLELPDHPDRVVLRVLEEAERAQPVPTQGLAAGSPSPGTASPAALGGESAQPTVPDEAADATPPQTAASTGGAGAPVVSEEHVDPPDAAAVSEPEVAPGREDAMGPGIPTFATSTADGSAASDRPDARSLPGRSTWERSWAQGGTPPTTSDVGASNDESTSAAATSDTSGAEEPAAQGHSKSAAEPSRTPEVVATEPLPAPLPALRSWTSVTPAVPVRATPSSDLLGDGASASGETPAPAAASGHDTSVPSEPVTPPTQPSASSPTEAVAPAASPSTPLVAQTAPAPVATTAPATTPVPTPPPAAPTAPTGPTAPAPVADDLPAAAPRDVDSTWAARPVLEPDASPTSTAPSAPVAGAVRRPAAGPTTSALDDPDETDDADDDQPAAPPSYDYLFGHTTAADEHRKVLASLTRSDEDEAGHDEDDHLPNPSVPSVADASDAPVTNAAPAPEVPARPIPSAPVVPEGGLISSVPWARSTPAAEVPKPEPEVPTFSGRHTPPPAPSLLPPMNTPPPGVRAPEATPLISTGPPPASTVPAPAPAPAPAQTAPSAPTAATAYASAAQPPAEPTFDVPVSLPVALPPVPPAATGTEPVADPPAHTADLGAGTDDDETELTVDRSALLEARNAAQNQTFSGPSVLAVLCSAGHPTPPHSDRCRVCGSSIPPQEPFTMPRPPLGVLRLSTGDVVTLDRSVLLGRAPKLGDGLAVHDRPHVVKVPSPERDVSRNHVEVILEGWHVLIRDLGTTNGTTVTLPGESPLRLRANDQQVLEPGSLVSMADEVSFTFEAAS